MEAEPPLDVAVMGCGFAGSAAALLLLRQQPGLRVALIDRRAAFDRGVGESTVEVSGHFLRHVLGLSDHLSRHHLTKQGLRFWFHESADTGFETASEIGPRQLARLPAWQIDRQALDEHLLELARAAGAEVLRPAKVRRTELLEESADPAATTHLIEIERDAEPRQILRARYLIDASGRSAIVARPRGWVRKLREEHPTAAVWARFTGMRDLDCPASMGLPAAAPLFDGGCIAPRRLATNHFTGRGYWIWAIPLHNGETSVGAVWDTRMVEPSGKTSSARLAWFLQQNPLTRYLLEDATPVEGDTRGLGNIAYFVDRVAGPGWNAVGDAAGFIDPFYSPGIDQVAFSIQSTVERATEALAKTGEELRDPAYAEEIAAHDEAYRRFFRHYFEALYRDKYELLGDYDLMTASMLIDTGLYYLTAVEPIYRRGAKAYRKPPFYTDDRGVGRVLVGSYKKRLLAIARRRQARGTYGKRNAGRRVLFGGFALGMPARRMLMRGVGYWLRAEVEHFGSYLWPFGAGRSSEGAGLAPSPQVTGRPRVAETAP